MDPEWWHGPSNYIQPGSRSSTPCVLFRYGFSPASCIKQGRRTRPCCISEKCPEGDCSYEKLHHDDEISWESFPYYWPSMQGIHPLKTEDYNDANKIWWLCLLPTSTTRFASDVGYRMARKLKGLLKEIIFMNSDIKFLNIEWRTPYPLTNLEDRFGLHAPVNFWDSNMCVFLFISTLARSHTLVVNWQN